MSGSLVFHCYAREAPVLGRKKVDKIQKRVLKSVDSIVADLRLYNSLLGFARSKFGWGKKTDLEVVMGLRHLIESGVVSPPLHTKKEGREDGQT